MKWYKHLCSSHQSSRLRIACGKDFLQSYGFYFLLVELVAMSYNGVKPCASFEINYLKSVLGGINVRTLEKLLQNFEQSELLLYKNFGKVIQICVPKLKEIQSEYSRKLLTKSGHSPDSVLTRSRSRSRSRIDKKRSAADSEVEKLKKYLEEEHD